MTKQIHVKVGTKLRSKANPDFGVMTIDKIDNPIDVFGDKDTSRMVARGKLSNGHNGMFTDVSQITTQWFEVVD